MARGEPLSGHILISHTHWDHIQGIPFFAPLFVPGDRPERFLRAAQSGADAVIIDIEDAVSPEHKAAARANASRHGRSERCGRAR